MTEDELRRAAMADAVQLCSLGTYENINQRMTATIWSASRILRFLLGTVGEGLRCSFCGKTDAEVKKLIAGPGEAYICDECVDRCNLIIAEKPGDPLAPAESGESSPAAGRAGNAGLDEQTPPAEGEG